MIKEVHVRLLKPIKVIIERKKARIDNDKMCALGFIAREHRFDQVKKDNDSRNLISILGRLKHKYPLKGRIAKQIKNLKRDIYATMKQVIPKSRYH